MYDKMSSDTSTDWSIFKTTSLLSDSISLYDEADLFNHMNMEVNPVYDMQTPKIKTEPLTELVPPHDQHYTAWQSKYIEQWAPQDCLFWLIHELQELKLGRTLPEAKMERIAHIDGISLKHMTLDDFNQIFPGFGTDLFHRLQKFKASFMCNSYYSFEQWSNPPLRGEEPFPSYLSPSQESHMLTDLDSEAQLSARASVPVCSPPESDSGYKSDSSEETVIEPPPVPEKRRPGRPRGTKRKKKPEKLGRLWEFIRDLLLNPQYNPNLICWENYDEGTFRFVHSDRVAKLWGSKKDNVDMNYEKLSRAMRYYYKSQVLLPVYGKRLVYKFGPTATGWRSERPIFRQS